MLLTSLLYAILMHFSHVAFAAEAATQLWAGVLTMPNGVANSVRMNMTVNENDHGAVASADIQGIASTQWTYTMDNAGTKCVPHAESGLTFLQKTNGDVTLSPDGKGQNFYAMKGNVNRSANPPIFSGVLVHGGKTHGTFQLIKNAPQLPPHCSAVPPPPPPAPPLAGTNSSVWPMPRNLTRLGAAVVALDSNFAFAAAANPSSNSAALTAAFERFRTICFPHRVATVASAEHGHAQATMLLKRVTVTVENSAEPLALGVDESYTLSIPGPDGDGNGYIKAATLFGAYHALESFAQLLQFNFDHGYYQITGTPVILHDAPRFPWRELMVDTSRHFLPVKVLKQVLDSMTTSKLNVLHVHLIDSQAFPLVLPSMPKLSLGAYSKQERYTLEDLEDVNEHAAARGIRVVAELDTPGHGASWCSGMPELCPRLDCLQPLDPSTNATFEAIGNVMKDLFSIFPDDFVHLGGDEVDTSCWNTTERIVDWMQSKGLTPGSAYGYFVSRTQALAHSYNKTAIVWDEVWNLYGTALNKTSTVINTRFNPNQAPKRIMCVANATAHGYRVVRSENLHWYLDQTVKKPWTAQYSFDLCGDLPASSCEFIVGGAASMWGETVDASDLMNTVWPRAGAVGEKLWTPQSLSNSSDSALPRYIRYRCYLNRRGIGAAPALNTNARWAPPGPGSCYTQ